jgi:antitoxin CptB
MRELDFLLQRYLERHYLQAPPAEQRSFEALLERQDPELIALVMGRELPSDPELARVVAKLTDPGT